MIESAPMRVTGQARRMRIMLLCSAFNGLSQRAWVELRQAGHEVQVQLATDADVVRAAVTAMDPDLVICPFLRERVPSEVWTTWPTIVIHPGPEGDRGPSSLDWAMMDAEPVWGVTALQAVDEMDAGPIWATRTFPVGRSTQERALQRCRDRRRAGAGPRGGGQGRRPRIRRPSRWTTARPERPGPAPTHGPPARPRVLLVRRERAHPAPDPGG